MMDRESWNGRRVTFAEFNLIEGDAIIDAFTVSRFQGSRQLLLRALRYADTGEPVFASLAEIEQLPFKHNERLSYLAGRCAFANGLGRDPDEQATPGQANGAAAADPSH